MVQVDPWVSQTNPAYAANSRPVKIVPKTKVGWAPEEQHLSEVSLLHPHRYDLACATVPASPVDSKPSLCNSSHNYAHEKLPGLHPGLQNVPTKSSEGHPLESAMLELERWLSS